MVPKIIIFSFKSLFTLNKIKIDIPLPVRRPASIEPKLITLLTYSSVITTLPAQLGIKPIILDKNGVKILPFNNRLEILSSPISCINI